MGDNPVRRNEDWFRENSNIPIREIAAKLLGLATSTVDRYWEECRRTTSFPSHPKLGGRRKKRGCNRNTRIPAGRGRAIQRYKNAC